MSTITNSQEHSPVDAGKILEMIKSGDNVNFKKRIIDGDLDFRNACPPKIHAERGSGECGYSHPDDKFNFVTSEIKLIDCQIQGVLNFKDTIFHDSVNFEGTVFKKDCKFNRSKFSNAINFGKTEFNEKAEFKYVKFCGNVIFHEASFHKTADFKCSKFVLMRASNGLLDGDIIFHSAIFNGFANFFHSEFLEYINFEYCEFSKGGTFMKAQFKKNATFENAIFDQSTTFEKAEFGDYPSIVLGADFKYVRFCKDIDFNNTIFHNDATFTHAKFEEYSDFNAARFYGDLMLDEARIYKMRMIGISFRVGSKIFLKNSDYVQLNVRWDIIKDYLDPKEAVCLSLINNFKNLGFFEDADDCYYQYRHWRRKGLIDWIAWKSCDYGVRLRKPLKYLILILLCYIYVIYASMGQETSYLNLARSILEGILGWLLMPLFIVVLARKLIR